MKRSQQAGIALVAVLMTSAILFIVVAVTSTMAFSNRRSTVNQTNTLSAQYAAESGLAYAQANLRQLSGLVQQVRVPANTTITNIEDHVKKFCGVTSLTQPTGAVGEDGVAVCQAEAGTVGSNRYSVFVDYAPAPNPADSEAAKASFWLRAFSGTAAPSSQITISNDGATLAYEVQYGLSPLRVRAMNSSRTSYTFDFELTKVRSEGTLSADGKTIAKRVVEQRIPGSANTFSMNLSLPSFAQYAHFRNVTTSTSDRQLYYGDGEVIDGPVHTNGKPGFLNTATNPEAPQGPQFLGRFTSAAAPEISGNVWPDAVMFPNVVPQFGVDPITLPTNSHNQLRAALGGSAADTSEVESSEITSAFGAGAVSNDGVYYASSGDTDTSWQGGIYVKGNVDRLTLSTTNGRQKISIVQGAKTTTFTQNADDSWTVNDGDTTRTLAAEPPFNGMLYVGGDVKALQGDGTGAADIASTTQMTLTATGTITLKDDITYADDPTNDDDATNVLGIYSSKGSILADGPNNRDLNLHASLMATAERNGFGTVNYSQSRGQFGSRKTRINLLGGLIENQSQTVSQGAGGYDRNYKYDDRFIEGLAPPFFPTQESWQTVAPRFDQQLSTWRTKGN